LVEQLKTYHGDFHREGDVWVAEVREVPQAHTYGRTLARTQAHLREALALVLDVGEDSFDLHISVQLDGGVGDLVENAVATRRQAEEVAEQSRVATEEAAFALVHDAKLSRRDAAVAMGISYQRVDQLVRARTNTKDPAPESSKPAKTARKQPA
jgi:predicted RNase H-like HicB family nuclease